MPLLNPVAGADSCYRNPIIYADYSDPDVIRVDKKFYLISSSFNCVPGLPILCSYDLLNWQLIGHAVAQLPAPTYDRPQPGRGIWAPALRYRNGEFYIYYGDPDLGLFLVKSPKPEGPWQPPRLVQAARGWIDPCPFWDDDGQAYLIHAWAKSRVGFNSILTLHRMSPDGTRILDEGVTVFDGHDDHPTIEGPKIYKRNGYYYIFAPAGGVKNGWQTVLRSRHIYGPYEDRIVLEQGVTAINGPHQGAWLETDKGESWFVHFQDCGAYGRIVHLQPLQWIDDWPAIGVDRDGNSVGEPVEEYTAPIVDTDLPRLALQTTDEFDQSVLGLQWHWQANSRDTWYSLTERQGFLRLFCTGVGEGYRNLTDLPFILSQKMPAARFTVNVKIDFKSRQEGERAGLAVLGSDYASLFLHKSQGAIWLTQVVCPDAYEGTSEVLQETVRAESQVFLRLAVEQGACCRFSYSWDGKSYNPIGTVFRAVAGRWVGAQIGLYASAETETQQRGYADFDYWRIEILP